MEIKKENLKDLLEIYELDGYWYVDFISGIYEGDPLNISMSNEGIEKALKNALIYLATDRLKLHELQDEIEELSSKIMSNSYDCRFDDLKEPTRDDLILIEDEN